MKKDLVVEFGGRRSELRCRSWMDSSGEAQAFVCVLHIASSRVWKSKDPIWALVVLIWILDGMIISRRQPLVFYMAFCVIGVHRYNNEEGIRTFRSYLLGVESVMGLVMGEELLLVRGEERQQLELSRCIGGFSM